MIGRYPDEVVRVVCAYFTPFVALFGIYVIAHGHYGPGGGFAGGVILAVSAIIPRLTLRVDLSEGIIPPIIAPAAGAVGMGLFLLCAGVPLAMGGDLLDYSVLTVTGISEAYARYLGIMVVEFAVGIAVFGAILLLFDVVLAREN